MEKSGSGFKKIYNEYQKYDTLQPVLENSSDYFAITLFDLLYKEDSTTSDVLYGQYDTRILEFCLGHTRSRQEIQEYISYRSRNHFMSEILTPLLESGLLISTAPNRSKNQKYLTNEEKYRP